MKNITCKSPSEVNDLRKDLCEMNERISSLLTISEPMSSEISYSFRVFINKNTVLFVAYYY